jgi:aspartate dehydrogenase
MSGGAVTVGILGLGRIGTRLVRLLAGAGDGLRVAAILARRDAGEVPRDLVCADWDAFLARKPDIVVECASRETLADLGPKLLAAGIDLVPLSLTAFCDPAVEASLTQAAARGPGRLEIPPGAIGTLDLLAAAREAGLASVVYRQSKSVAAWRVSPAATLVDLDAIAARSVFLAGSVREIAAKFPNNLNVSVGVALAGLGLDRTRVELVADPAATATTHTLEIVADPGTASLQIGGRAVPPGGDPADYTTYSLMRVLRRRVARVAF